VKNDAPFPIPDNRSEAGKPSSLGDWIRHFNSHDAHPVLQFVKYGIAGGLATGTHMVVFFAAAWWLFPALTATDPFVRLFALVDVSVPVPEIGDAVRSNRVLYNNCIAFLFSNAVAYIINILWVFRRGRHGWLKEMLLFFAVSAFSMACGSVLAFGMVRWMGAETTYAFAANIVASVLINYAARKFFIFKG